MADARIPTAGLPASPEEMQGQSARRRPGLRVGPQLLSNQEVMSQGPGRRVGAPRVHVPTWAGVCGAANMLKEAGEGIVWLDWTFRVTEGPLSALVARAGYPYFLQPYNSGQGRPALSSRRVPAENP